MHLVSVGCPDLFCTVKLLISCRSLQKYKFVLRNFKLMCVLVTSRPRLELMKITKHVDEGRIRARWRVMGVSRFFPFRGERLVF